VELFNSIEIEEFERAHAQSRRPLESWRKAILNSDWNNFAELKTTFNSADYVLQPDFYIFNVGGNKYRILARVSFKLKMVLIVWIKGHAEYDKWSKGV
jgi:mRNA interferase HigB